MRDRATPILDRLFLFYEIKL